MKKISRIFTICAAVTVLTMAFTSCNDKTSYSDLLNTERYATNAFLANHRVVNGVPADSVFEVGEDAPFYRLDDLGNVYMQVIKAGDRKNNKAKTGDKIYFRYMRYNLIYWHENGVWEGAGNEKDMSLAPSYIVYNNFTLTESAQWGYGLQTPLLFLGVDCEVNLIIKSQQGVLAEYAYVQPFFYHVRYFRSQI